jgi:hypothetical protein
MVVFYSVKDIPVLMYRAERLFQVKLADQGSRIMKID